MGDFVTRWGQSSGAPVNLDQPLGIPHPGQGDDPFLLSLFASNFSPITSSAGDIASSSGDETILIGDGNKRLPGTSPAGDITSPTADIANPTGDIASLIGDVTQWTPDTIFHPALDVESWTPRERMDYYNTLKDLRQKFQDSTDSSALTPIFEEQKKVLPLVSWSDPNTSLRVRKMSLDELEDHLTTFKTFPEDGYLPTDGTDDDVQTPSPKHMPRFPKTKAHRKKQGQVGSGPVVVDKYLQYLRVCRGRKSR